MHEAARRASSKPHLGPGPVPKNFPNNRKPLKMISLTIQHASDKGVWPLPAEEFLEPTSQREFTEVLYSEAHFCNPQLSIVGMEVCPQTVQVA